MLLDAYPDTTRAPRDTTRIYLLLVTLASAAVTLMLLSAELKKSHNAEVEIQMNDMANFDEITIGGLQDSFGGQYHAIMSGFAFAHSRGLMYKHTPLSLVEGFSEDDVASLNRFIGMSSDPGTSPDHRIFSTTFSAEVQWSKAPSAYYTPEVRRDLRAMYDSTVKPYACPYDIAIHMPRPETATRIEDSWYFALLEYFITKQSTLESVPRSIGIYSDDMTDYLKSKLTYLVEVLTRTTTLARDRDTRISFEVNIPVETAFHHFVTAPILVMSRDSATYAAAILKMDPAMTVLFPAFGHSVYSALDDWVPLGNSTQLLREDYGKV